MARIMLGPAGSSGYGTLEGIGFVKEQGLQCMEVEFVRGVHMKNELAKRCGRAARELGISLSIHAPYYINLASAETEKRRASIKRILDSCERGHHLGATHVVFHPAYYGKLSPEKTYEIVRDAVGEMQSALDKKGWKVRLAPETTGKVSQWGTLDETLELARETGCSFCIDFAHIYARDRGNIDYGQVLEKIQKAGFKHVQAHFSNINYGLRGELNHLVLDGKPPFEPLAREILRKGLDATIISESPITWKDSLKMRGIFEKLGHKFQ
jgi:deoxyribonuclease-4